MALTRTDPYRGYNFAVEIDNITSAAFKDCSGLDTSTSEQTYREGTDATLVQRKIPGMVTVSNITLSRGVTADRELWDWRQKVANGDMERKNISVVLRDDTGAEKIRWNLRECWPTKWTGPSLDATGDAISIESLEITHEGLEVKDSDWN